MFAILTLLKRPMPLDVVVMHEASVNGECLFPARRFGKFRVGHFSDNIEVRLYIVLPGLLRLYALFSDSECGVDVHCLVATKLATPVTDQNRWSTKGRERIKDTSR
jgi:hypothetical protein